MADTPTFANLLTQWRTGDPDVRASVYAHLHANPAEAAAVEAFLRDDLIASLPWRRVIAAEAVVELYRDEGAAAAALAWVLRQGDVPAAGDAARLVRRLSPGGAVALLRDLALDAADAFRALPADFHRWAGGAALGLGEDAHSALRVFLMRGDPRAVSALLVGIGTAAPAAGHGVEAATEQFIRNRLLHADCGYAAGAALWRLTWRVNRDWLASIDARDPRFENDSLLLVLLVEVLTEHLGRRPDFAPVVRDLLVRLAADHVEFKPLVKRLAALGARGWTVLLPVLGDTAVPPLARAVVFRSAWHVGVRALAHHHAHSVILERARDRAAVPDELLDAAGMVLYSLDRAAGSAIPDLLDLIVKQPDTVGVLVKVVAFTVKGFPNPAAAVARTLDRLRRSVVFAPGAFAALAGVYAWLDLDGATRLVEDTSLDPRTPETLLQQAAWTDALPDVRRRHALGLANSLGSPRPEVRARAADALRHYPDQMPAVWPALVALLAGTDEKAVLLVLPLFRHLTPATEATTELRELFREPNPTRAARAVVALWRLGRMPLVADDLREAVVTAKDDAWGWAVLRGVVDRVVQAHGLLHDLSDVFAAAPQEVAAKVHALLNPPELAEEAAIAVHVPRPDDATGPQAVNWNGVYQCVGQDAEGGLLFLALMCAFGSQGFAAQKIWLIKHQRTLSGTGLAEAKGAVERAIANLTATATPGDKRACVRDYFPAATVATAVPKGITDLLEHRVSWYRWAGLELLDAWGAAARVPGLIEDRVWDRSALVRVRALRMNHG